MFTQLVCPTAASQETACDEIIRTTLEHRYGVQVPVKFTPCDLFSLCELERLMRNADAVLYFSPDLLSAGLTQGSERDLELICADNVAYAAQQAGVKQLIYLRGSAESQNSLEIQETLRSRGIPVEGILLPEAEFAAAINDTRRLKPHRHSRSVRSVQRFKLPGGKSAAWAARGYASWLARSIHPLGRVEISPEGDMSFYGRGIRRPLLVLTFSAARSSSERALYFITGGLLAEVEGEHKGRLEFREVLGGRTLIVAIHDYSPSLPWQLYRSTQAIIHLWVMAGYGRFLENYKGTRTAK